MNAQHLVVMLILIGSIVGMGLGTASWATIIYSYVDDQGNLAYTDTPETIPEKYRARVKTHEQRDTTSTQPPPSAMQSMKQSVQQTVTERVKSMGFSLPSLTMEGLTPSQSNILSYAGTIAGFLLLVMYLSSSQLVRMLGFCLLVVLGIGAPILMYVDNTGPIGTIKTQASASGQVQQDRTRQLP